MVGKAPLVSVIIPTFNSAGTLRLTLETVLRQDFPDFEVWVVGDGCRDESAEAVASFADDRLHWINLPANSGSPAAPRNEGLCLARGRLIAQLGHDDLWFPWHLSGLVKTMETTGCDFVYSLGAMIGPSGVTGTFSLPRRAWNIREPISPSNWLHHENLAGVIGPWSLKAGVGCDRDYLERLQKAKVRFACHEQLSVLKFPAALWRMYALDSEYPQTKYVEAVRKDPAALRLEVLQACAGAVSHRMSFLPRHASPLRRFLSEVLEFGLNLYGPQRWPVSRLYRLLWRRRSGL